MTPRDLYTRSHGMREQRDALPHGVVNVSTNILPTGALGLGALAYSA